MAAGDGESVRDGGTVGEGEAADLLDDPFRSDEREDVQPESNTRAPTVAYPMSNCLKHMKWKGSRSTASNRAIRV
jgi:hypothetical protein